MSVLPNQLVTFRQGQIRVEKGETPNSSTTVALLRDARGNALQISKEMLYKIPDLPFRANFWSTNNAVRVKAMVRYCKEFKILVNPAHSIEYSVFIMRKCQKGGKYTVRVAKLAIEISRDSTTHII